MKKIISLFVIGAAVSFTTAVSPFSAKSVEKSFGKIKEGIYAGKYEVSNASYREFLDVLKAEGNIAKYNACMPDTLVWRNTLTSYAPLTSSYFNHPSFAEYPVVGVSYESAEEYCKWLTDQYNRDHKKKYSNVTFRLPTKEEWILAANGGDEKKQYPWGTGFIHNNRSMALCNFREDVEMKYDEVTKKYDMVPDASDHKRLKLTSPVKSFFPSSFGLYNMSGNVAEMIAEKGTAMGGSFIDPAWMVTVRSEKKYAAPASDIGFRVVMETTTR